MNVKTSSRHFPFNILNIKVPSAATPPGERPSILGNFVVRLEIYYEIHKTFATIRSQSYSAQEGERYIFEKC